MLVVTGTYTYGEGTQQDKRQAYYQCLSQFYMINNKSTVDCIFNKPIGEGEDLIGVHEGCFEEHKKAVDNLFNGCKPFLD